MCDCLGLEVFEILLGLVGMRHRSERVSRRMLIITEFGVYLRT